MKNQNSNFPSLQYLLVSVFFLFAFSLNAAAVKRDFYEIKVYKVKNIHQTVRVENFLKEAYIPAMHRAGIKNIGVFKPISTDPAAGKVIVVWIPYKSLDQIEKVLVKLEKDPKYIVDGEDYLNAKFDNPPYERIESTILKAFSHMPKFSKPQYSNDPSERIYELRSYESATEKIFTRKVEMFNEGGELALFERLGFNALFYGEVISGSTMPNLMYMTTFSDSKVNKEKWQTFRDDPEWKVLSGLEKYKNTVSRIEKYLLYPTEYSDI